jgi:glucokinase
MSVCLAVDVGASKLAAGLVDLDGRLEHREVVPTPRAEDAEELFGVLAELVTTVAGRGRPVVCGVGCGGPMAEGGVVSPLNIPAWRSFPLGERLASVTGLPTAVDNDAKAIALAEGWRGAARGRRAFLGMVVSSGVGGGIVLDGRLLEGRTGNAGHVGHVVVEPEGRPCGCGGRGCLEAEASGLAIEAATGRPPSEAGAEVVARTGRLVGRAVASVAQLLDLDLAVVAGSVALGFGAAFFAAAEQELHARAGLAYARAARILPAGLGADAPLIGAAAVGFRAFGGAPGLAA